MAPGVFDRFGPLTFKDPSPMDVGAHPHMGLQTATWLLDGELVHYDSLGNESLLRPGGVNVMTSGSAIAHAERTPSTNSGRLSGAQLWVALPDRARQMSALFQHVDRVPVDVQPGGIVQVFAGASVPWPHPPRIIPESSAAMSRCILEPPSRCRWT